MPKTQPRRVVVLGIAALALVVSSGALLVGSLDWVLFEVRFEEIEQTSAGFRRYRHKKTGFVMVEVPVALVSDRRILMRPFLISEAPVTPFRDKSGNDSNPSVAQPKDARLEEFCRRAALQCPTEHYLRFATRCGALTLENSRGFHPVYVGLP